MTNHSKPSDRKPKGESSPAARLVSLLLLALALGLAVAAFFALQEILLALGAQLIAAGGGDSIRQRYSLATLRNVGAIGSGGLLLVWVIGGGDYFMRRLDRPESRRRLLWILALEMLIIGLNAAIAA